MSQTNHGKIRILEIDARGDLGGGSTHLATLLSHLSQDEFEIYAASPLGQVNSKKYNEVTKGFFPIPFRRFDFNVFSELKQFVQKHQIHLIHSHGRGAGIYSRLLGKDLNLPVIHTFHGVTSVSLRTLLEFQFEKWLAQFTTRFVHVSDSEQKYAASLGISNPDRSEVISNGINFKIFHEFQKKERLEIRSKLGFKESDMVLGCVARFDPVKNHYFLVEAFSSLSVEFPHLKLVLIGTGETENQIKELVKQRGLEHAVQFLGEKDEIAPFYAAFDIFVLTSQHEGLPITLLEALASKCPVVLSDVRGNRDVVNEDVGILFPNSDVSAFQNAIRQLINNPDLRAQLAENGYHMVHKRFSVQRTCELIQKTYQELCPYLPLRRVALAHDWLFHMRGGEKVIESIGDLFPAAPIYTLFADPKKLSLSLRKHQIFTSCLNNVPFISKFYRFLLPVFPVLVHMFNLKNYELIISSSHAVIKGVEKAPHAIHICYCHTPMRYAWGFESEYLGKYPFLVRKLALWYLKRMRKWDLQTNSQVDFFIANSENVRNRIKNFYQREAHVIYPPIKIPETVIASPKGAKFAKKQGEIRPDESRLVSGGQSNEHGLPRRSHDLLAMTDDFFLVVSAIVPYKRVDIAIDAFNELSGPLFIIGSGPLKTQLEKSAKSNIKFLGWLSDKQIVKYYASCRALIFPTEEDFGMVPLEAMSYGKPVIAYRKGGALETVISPSADGNSENATGLFFDEQTPESLKEAIKRFERCHFNPEVIRKHAEKFKGENFRKRFTELFEVTIKVGDESFVETSVT